MNTKKLRVLDYDALVRLNDSSIRAGRLRNLPRESLAAVPGRLYAINLWLPHHRGSQGEVRLSVVLDHCFSLTAGDLLEPSVKKVVELARIPNLHAKLSFLPMGSAEEHPFRDMHDALRRILRAFGPERCIWGSDFPTQLFCPKVTYAGHLRLFQEELGLTSREQEHILETTPARLYFGAS